MHEAPCVDRECLLPLTLQRMAVTSKMPALLNRHSISFFLVIPYLPITIYRYNNVHGFLGDSVYR